MRHNGIIISTGITAYILHFEFFTAVKARMLVLRIVNVMRTCWQIPASRRIVEPLSSACRYVACTYEGSSNKGCRDSRVKQYNFLVVREGIRVKVLRIAACQPALCQS
jgi:hypothetical protein